MKHLMILLMAFVVVTACDGIDRDEMRNKVVQGFEDEGYVIDAACVGGVLDGYSDDALTAIGRLLEAGERLTETAYRLLDDLLTCRPATN